METVTAHSLQRASEQAVLLWSLASAQFPKENHLVLNLATAEIIEITGAFALNARRTIESLPSNQKFPLVQPRWNWKAITPESHVKDLWDALNRIIHAKKLQVGFELVPEALSAMVGGAVVVPYIKAQTDRKELSFIDPFAMAHAFLYGVLPSVPKSIPQGGALQ